jgi:hypothetical protein
MEGSFRRPDGSSDDRSFWEEVLGEDLRETTNGSYPREHASMSDAYLTFHDFGTHRSPWVRCPIIGCTSALKSVRLGRSARPYCAEHGIRLHSDSFVYFNGPTKADRRRARLRNFAFAREFISEYVLDSPDKAETHRLGYETSEDALSWNVFAALMIAGRLRDTATWLTGRPVGEEPELYMWGCLVDLREGTAAQFDPLKRVRRTLEPHIIRFFTEPDIMLVIPGKLVVCIEAKFTSGNPMTTDATTTTGEKPKSRDGLISCYLDGSASWRGEAQCLYRERIPAEIPSQLFRNIVFCARMAELEGPQAEWHVVNLVSSTQWRDRKASGGYSFDDPTSRMEEFLTERGRHFSFRSWENLYATMVRDDPALSELGLYIEQKSAHFVRAFDL